MLPSSFRTLGSLSSPSFAARGLDVRTEPKALFGVLVSMVSMVSIPLFRPPAELLPSHVWCLVLCVSIETN